MSEWNAAWTSLRPVSVDDEEWDALGRSLRRRHEEPGRHYHGVEHVEAVLRVAAELQSHGRTAAVDLAAFFHDAIYVAAAGDNELRSAELARTELGRLEVDPTMTAEVSDIVEATAGHRSNGEPAVELFLDADLSILGTDADLYDRYTAGIRAEYAHLGDEAWRVGRAMVLQGFLERPQLFFTAAGRERFEAAARRNIGRELLSLR